MFVRTIQFAASYFNRDVELGSLLVGTMTGDFVAIIELAATAALFAVLLFIRCDFDPRALV